MKKLLKAHLLLALATTPIYSQEFQDEELSSEPETENMTEMPLMQAGDGSVGSAQAAQSSNWQNWAVAGGALVAAAIGVVIVATNSGSPSHHD